MRLLTIHLAAHVLHLSNQRLTIRVCLAYATMTPLAAGLTISHPYGVHPCMSFLLASVAAFMGRNGSIESLTFYLHVWLLHICL